MKQRLFALCVVVSPLWAPLLLWAFHAGGQQWTELGPAPITSGPYTGRVSAIACSSTNAHLYYVGGADGGVWRSTDAGATWTPLTDHMPSSAIGALVLDPGDENIIYAGTGEANFANHSRYGLGLYKSIDGGATWSHLAEATFGGRCFSKIVIDPGNTQTLYASITRAGGFPTLAAAKGHPGANGPVGVFKSTDGGATWNQLSGGLPPVDATDLVIDPANPAVLYAAIGHIFGHAGNGIYKTVNGGATWTELAGGLPTGTIGRISVAIAPSNPNRLYALVTNPSSSSGGNASSLGAFRSDNAGATWAQIPVGSMQATYGWYLSAVSVQPTNPDAAFFAGFSLRRTTNAGSSFSTVTPPHVDLHALAWDAAGRLLSGDDGGVHRSSNLGSSWTALNNGLGIVQFYAGLSSHPTNPAILFGGTQDNGSNRRNTNTRNWSQVLGGDGGWTQLDRVNPLRVFAEFQGTGELFRSTDGGSNFGGASSGIDGGDRNCFLPPYLIHPTDSNRMLYGTHRVYRSVNGGSSWSPISADLTDGQGAIRALAQSPVDPQIVYAATNDGNVLVSMNEGATFIQIVDGHPGWPRVTRELHASGVDARTIYLATARFGQPQVRRSTDAGQSWQTVDGDLPDVPVNVVVEVFRFTRQIFAGTDQGVYFSPDDGKHWQPYGQGLPRAAVIDLLVDETHGRLIAATQGRGAWSAPLFPEPAEVTDLEVVRGSALGGGIPDLADSDNEYFRTKSGFGQTLTDLHSTVVIVGASSTVANPATIDLTFETRLSHPTGACRVSVRDWNTTQFVEVGQFAMTNQDEVDRITGVIATNFVREADGRIELSIRHVVVVPVFAFTFDSFFDVVEVMVN